jgi:hypothetical protein
MIEIICKGVTKTTVHNDFLIESSSLFNMLIMEVIGFVLMATPCINLDL